jgi:hypothetical protein
MMRALLAGLVIAAMAVPAAAYDFLYTGETANPQERGTYRVDLSFLYLTSDEVYGKDGTTLPMQADWTATWIPFEIDYAFTDRVSAGVNAKYGLLTLAGVPSDNVQGQRAEGRDYSGASFGDLWLWAKYNALESPWVTGRVGLKMPLSSEPADRAHAAADTGFYLDENGDLAVGDGQVDIDAAVLLGFPGESGMFELSLGYRYRASQTVEKSGSSYDYKPGDEIHFNAGYRYDLNDALSLRLGLDGFYGSDDGAETDYDESGHSPESIDERLSGSARNGVWINPSFVYQMTNGILLGFDVHYPLMGQNIPAEWGVGFHVGFAR